MTVNPALEPIERRLSEKQLDFSETFVRVGQLKEALADEDSPATENTVQVLAALLASDRHLAQTHSFQLYNVLAGILADIGCAQTATAVSRRALETLLPAATGSRGEKQRAAAGTVGMLPVGLKGPRVDFPAPGSPRRTLSPQAVLAHAGLRGTGEMAYLGRSLVTGLKGSPEVAVIKITRRGESPAGLGREAAWMDYLTGRSGWRAGRFVVPRPVKVGGNYLFKPTGLPSLKGQPREIGTAAGASAIAFTVHRDYFVYPNDHRPDHRLPYERFQRVLRRAAGLFGELASAGIVHTAPVPLFHNRVQRNRREDGGIYEWDRGGRLDRWLFSSRFPNFGPSGIRDFEHLATVGEKNGRRLYRHIGNQLLSLILVAGSYFRYKAPEMVGVEAHGEPVDLRHLFDRAAFTELVGSVFSAYFNGFTGAGQIPDMVADIEYLVECLIEQMGVDRHMGEVLRVADQERMSAGTFNAFLDRYHLRQVEPRKIEKGAADIAVRSGPHLGAFNGRLSVPELTSFLRSASAAVVAGKFLVRRFPGDWGGGNG